MTSSNSLVQHIRICWWAVLKLDENPSRPERRLAGGEKNDILRDQCEQTSQVTGIDGINPD
jgi:hypothetical protein